MSQRLSLRRLALVWALFTAAALGVYAPALRAPFFSDDMQYVVHNPYIQGLGWSQLAPILDPSGDPAVFTWNYAPVHLLASAIEWRVFGDDPLGYHVVNVLLHAAASTLLVAFFAASGIAELASIVLGAVFLLHPANVESVAWIFQLKTILALGLSVAALLAFRSRPGLAWLLFSLALLAKVTAAYALPVVACWLIVSPPPQRRARAWAWVGAWAAVTLLCVAAGLPHFENTQTGRESAYADLGVQLRSMFAIGGRYLAMATTTWGLSAFQEPAPAVSWRDGWWLFGVLAVATLGLRCVMVLRRRSVEAIYWIWAGVSFAAVSQVLGFIYPIADRYLYAILPGLLGAGGFALQDALRSFEARRRTTGRRLPAPERLRAAGMACAVVVVLLLGVRSVERARLWGSELSLLRDSALHYPEGRVATFLRARRAAVRGDLAASAALLSHLADLGHETFAPFYQDPAWAGLIGRPDFDAALAKMADNWIRSVEGRPRLVQADLRALAQAYVVRGDLPQAIDAYERALARGGPLDAEVRQELVALRQRAAEAPAP